MDRFEETAASTAAGVIGAYMAVNAAQRHAQWWASLPPEFKRFLTLHLRATVVRAVLAFVLFMFLAWQLPGDLGGCFGLVAFVGTPVYVGVRLAKRSKIGQQMTTHLQVQRQAEWARQQGNSSVVQGLVGN